MPGIIPRDALEVTVLMKDERDRTGAGHFAPRGIRMTRSSVGPMAPRGQRLLGISVREELGSIDQCIVLGRHSGLAPGCELGAKGAAAGSREQRTNPICPGMSMTIACADREHAEAGADFVVQSPG
jgi:hypothetical protein